MRNSISARILKVTGMFGSLQGVGIISSVVRTKLIAMWIGPAAMGLFAIYNTALESLYALTQMGLQQTGVREISAHRNPSTLNRVITIVRRWGLILGVLGMLLTVACSPLLSDLSFGTAGRWTDFVWLSLLVGITAYNVGEIAVLQGLERFKPLATSQMVGYLGGLLICAPLYWFFGMKSILPSIIIHQTLAFLVIMWYRARVAPPVPPVGLHETLTGGRTLIRLGAFLTITAFITRGTEFGFNAWLNRYASTADVGFYQSGFTLVNRYVGLVFTAIAMEYYPRLSSVVHSRRATNVYVSNQVVITMLLIGPVVTLFMACAPLIIRILYTSEFLVIQPFIIWAAMGTVMRGLSWCLAFVIMARAHGRVFLVTEGLSGVLFVVFNVLFYTHFGISGMGYAYVAWYASYLAIIAVVYLGVYRLQLSGGVLPLTLYTLAIATCGAMLATIVAPWAAFAPFLLSAYVSFRLLRRKLA